MNNLSFGPTALLRLAFLTCAIAALSITGCGGSGGGSSSTTTTGSGTTPPTAALTVTAVSPTDVPVGSSDITLTVTGTGFAAGTTVALNTTTEPTTFISSTEIHATVSAAQLATGAVLTVSVSNGTTVVKADAKTALSVDNPAPTLTAVTPASVLLGTNGSTITVTGTNFVQGVALSVNGSPRTTTFVSATQLTAALTAQDFATASPLLLNVINPQPGGGASGTGSLAVNNAVPVITSLSPSSLNFGATAASVTIAGSNFVPATTVQVNGVTRAAAYVSATQMTINLTAADLASAGTLAITIANPTPGGGTSNTNSLTVNNPSPSIASLSPSSFNVGAAATSVTISGSNFLSSTTVQVNGTARTSAYISATQMTVNLTATDLATAGTLAVTTINPAPGGGTSAAGSIMVNNPAPIIGSLSPGSVVVGAAAATVTITGTGFLPTTVLQVNGTTRTATYVSATQMTVALTATDFATIGNLAITLVNATPGGGTSPALNFVVAAKAAATPVITSLNPASLVVGSAATQLFVSGTGFTTQSKVLWNGTQLTTVYATNTIFNGITYQSVPYLAATVPASLLTTKGTVSVTVTTPGAAADSNVLSLSITDPPAPTISSANPVAIPLGKDAAVSIYGTGYTAATTVTFGGAPCVVTSVTSTSIACTFPASGLTRPGLGTLAVTTPAPGGGTATVPFLAYVPLTNNSMVYNPVNGLLYASIPSSVGAPLGNSVVSVDPATGALGKPIPVGSEPNKLAITADGKYLWVGLDGSSAVRKVDLTSGMAGLQFSLATSNSGYYNPPGTALALAALPGATDSVVVASSVGTFSSPMIAIYDSGVSRASIGGTNSYGNLAYALQVDGTKNEIYAGGNSFSTYLYTANSITQQVSNTNSSPASYNFDEMQLLAGRIYTDTGRVLDAESGATLGTYYSSGSTVSSGPQVTDAAAGKTFMLNQTTSYAASTQIQAFNSADFTAGGTVSVPLPYSSTYSTSGARLSRWGANGLAFRTPDGVFSLQTSIVKDLSATAADLGVAVSASGTKTTGSKSVFTAVVSNTGPSTASDVVLSVAGPSNGVLTAASSTAGTCYLTTNAVCSLGNLANGVNATATFEVLQTSSGNATLTASVVGSTTDANSMNNAATATLAIVGDPYALSPVIASISPSAIQAGAQDTVVTVLGANFTAASQVHLGTAALTTSVVSSSKLMATVPAASLANLGWSAVGVSTSAPGGGTSLSLPLTVYKVLTLGANHILTDPYSRQIMVSVGSGSSAITGNTIAALTPDTAAFDTAVPIGSQPTNMALTSDGQVLYTILSGNQSVARFNMLTRTADFTYAVPNSTNFIGGISLRGIAAQPGTENTVALDIASFTGNAIYDFDPTAKTAAIRGQASGPYTGSCLAFLDATNLLAFDVDTSYFSLDHYAVTASGFTYYNYSQYTTSTLNHFGCFKLSGGLAFANAGGIADPSTATARQIATLPTTTSGGYSTSQGFVPDVSLQRAFYPTSSSTYSSTLTGLTSFDLQTYLASSALPIDFGSIEGSTSYNLVDMVRWGQDGLAMLTSTGHIYLLRGPFVAPQELNTNTAAALTSSSSSTITHGTGNTLLVLTGSNFVPGVAVTWNGRYRTTTIVDATHVSVAIPASDLAAAGSGSLVATNPGASASSALTVTIQ